MNVVDSSAWIEFFVDGPNSAQFARVLRKTDELIVPTISVFEVYKWIRRRAGQDEALRAVAVMRQGRLVPLDESVALHAAELGLEVGLPLADSVIYAVARREEALLWTQDSDFDGLDGVRFIPKAES